MTVAVLNHKLLFFLHRRGGHNSRHIIGRLLRNIAIGTNACTCRVPIYTWLFSKRLGRSALVPCSWENRGLFLERGSLFMTPKKQFFISVFRSIWQFWKANGKFLDRKQNEMFKSFLAKALTVFLTFELQDITLGLYNYLSTWRQHSVMEHFNESIWWFSQL